MLADETLWFKTLGAYVRILEILKLTCPFGSELCEDHQHLLQHIVS